MAKYRSHMGWPKQWTCVIFYCSLWSMQILVQHGIAEALNRDFQIPEDFPVGGIIGNVTYGIPNFPPPYLSFTDSETIVVSEETGEIKVVSELDREEEDNYQIFVSGGSVTVEVNIVVLDVNDNSPRFLETYVSKTLVESTPIDNKVALGSAVDPDNGINTTQRYEIVSGNTNSAFKLGSKRAANGILYLDLEINRELDYEETSHYLLLIRAYDGGNPARTGDMSVNITIVDANDNQPVFNNSRYFAQVQENATVGTSVLQVSATDADSGENGNVRYQINRQRSDPQENFEINPISGIISVNKNLDYETTEAYELIVVAKDNGTQKLQNTAVVSVEVLNVNDNQPVIEFDYVNEDSGRISETAQEGDTIARISVTDPDVKGQANISVTLSGGGNYFGLLVNQDVVYVILLSGPPDREDQPFFELAVTATDSGQPPLQSTYSFTLYVADTNDNAPSFKPSVYYADIQEIVPPGSSVIQVTAEDHDEGNNSMIIYSILDTPSTHSDWFQINNRTGLITTRMRVDCETSSRPRLTVVATDNGTPPMSASATVIVTIRDVNDNQPVFDQSFYNVTALESISSGTCILMVSATDPDCGSDTYVHYSIDANMGFEYPDVFEIDRDSGEVCLTATATLDYEAKQTYDFAVVATDQDGQETSAMVKVYVHDTNDNNPILYPLSYRVSIEQTSPVDTEIVVIRATDRDSGMFGTVQYSISGGNNQDIFKIDEVTGILKLKRQLPTSPQSHTLFIKAMDLDNLWSRDDAQVTVTVLDPSKNPPEFEMSLYRFDVYEDVDQGHSVGKVEATVDGDDPVSVTYSIVSGDPQTFFSIDPNSGEIRSNKALDHDTVRTVLLNIQAEAGNPPYFGQAQANISILDVNDNTPSFPVSRVEIPVKENAALSSTIFIAHARDRDSKDNGKVYYTLSPADIFAISRQNGEIYLQQGLDYETTQTHELVVTAQDNGSPAKSSSLDVVIRVQDVNDNFPVFAKSEYTFSLQESTIVNAKFGPVNATDLDTGNNAQISYILKNSPFLDTFGIFANNGFLYNKLPLDREKEAQYILDVVAIDNGIPAKSSSVQVTIDIIDANDNLPEFREESYTFYIEENKPANTFLGEVSATDRDQMESLTYSLVPDSALFKINPVSGVLSTKASLDREEVEKHTLTVRATDSGSPPQSNTVKVNVFVLDVNDNKPKFDTIGSYTAYIEENQPKGTRIIRVSADDLDKGENQTISYSLDNNANRFTIHHHTGVITTTEVLDHETRSRYNLQVKAKDGGNPPMITTAQVEVIVEDVNETPPIFVNANESFTVRENKEPGSVVGSVKARDDDSGENGRVLYYMTNGNLFGTFGINTTTGAIYISRPVDYEMCSAYSIQIKAIDNNPVNPMSNVINVNITVIDINDNAPVFDKDPIVFSIRENMAVGTAVYSFTAIDKDSNNNGKVNYEIMSQSPNGDWFTIGPLSGVLSISSLIDYEETTKISIVVKATDQAANPDERLFSTVTAVIVIEDINDNSPVFQSSNLEIPIAEDEPIGFPIHSFIAVDSDANENGRVTYQIANGNALQKFSLDADSGLLSIVQLLDREQIDHYTLNISARDHGYPPRSSFQELKIVIIDVNDNAPSFDKREYTASVQENAPQGAEVIQIQATDRDLGDNAELVYIIPDGIGDNTFSIHRKTGQITTNSVLDREQRSTWTITAYVKDSAFPALYATTTVVINVQDDNDNSPAFTDNVYDLTVPENSRSVIHTVMAADADTGENGKVVYSIQAGDSDNKFSIDPNTGQLSCEPLDREMTAYYNLTIRAQDRGSTPLHSHSIVLITVLDDNDNDPEFGQKSYTASFPENTPIGRTLITIDAIDRDQGDNAKIMYSMNNDAAGQFRIDNVTGTLTLATAFDREKQESYEFDVYAVDGGLYGPRQNHTRVRVIITDINDNAPEFEQIPYRASINQNHGANNFVVHVIAVDRDQEGTANSDVIYTFAEPSSYFRIDAANGRITTKTGLGPDAVILHELEVIARDQGSPQMSSTGLVEIQVGNAQGDETLTFSQSEYDINLVENSPRGTPVTTVLATRDSGSSSGIYYSFFQGNDGSFEIGQTSGVITVKDPDALDYEIKKQTRLIVQAATSSGTSIHGYATVWINLQDANDNAPKFTSERYTSAVWEGNPPGTFVTQVIANDLDEGENAEVTYTIIAGNKDNAFALDSPRNGIIKTNIYLDREIISSFRLEIEAVDHGHNHLSSTCVLRIQVVDVNDAAPFFKDYAPLNIKENTPPGTMIMQVTATDTDANPVLHYNFTANGNPDGAFSIDAYSGKIAVAKTLDYESRPMYVLKVEASDKKHTAETEVLVYIEDENDNTPVFSSQSYQVAIDELTPAHRSVITVNATDRDSGENARITYSMASPGFYIDQRTGTIYTNKTVVYNSNQPTIHLVVTARDHGVPTPHFEMAAVWVEVRDINNNRPIFTQDKYINDVSESADKGHTVMQVSATDEDDLHENKKIEYSILSGNEENVFEIAITTGEIWLNGNLDRERTSDYTLQIQAADRGTPRQSSTCQVEIKVNDVNDNAPVFNSTQYTATIPESKNIGDTIVQVFATDLDAGDNGRIEYKVTSGNDDHNFDVDRDSGLVTVRTALDYETRSNHKLIITAQDSSKDSPQQSALTTVVVNITDVNEYGPRFPVPMYLESVNENQPVNTLVFAAHANDDDSGYYGIVEYTISNEDGYFIIDSNTGDVKTNQEFNFENRDKYNFRITARDNGGRNASIQVEVTITPEDEFKPSFTKAEYTFDVPGNAKAGHYIGQVQATDKDGGYTGNILYRLEKENDYFAINKTSGDIYVLKDLQSIEDENSANSEDTAIARRKRDAEDEGDFINEPQEGEIDFVERKKRALADSSVTLKILASSGFPGSKEDSAEVVIEVDRTCTGCEINFLPNSSKQFELKGTPLVLLIVFAIISVILIVVVVAMYLRGRHIKRKRLAEESHFDSSFDTIEPPRVGNLPPPYNEVQGYNSRMHSQITTSEISDQSHSASSGRGSAEGDDDDEEIRMINETPVEMSGDRVPDSGIQQDDDALSDHSVQNHQEYLARLGIDTSKLKTSTVNPKVASSVESMHQFSEEGGGEAVGLEVVNINYAKLGEVETSTSIAMMNGSREYGYGEATVSQSGSLSSVINSEEEFSGSYNWDYLLDWGPQYQPLADVFSEIARLKDDNIKPKKAPTKIVPQGPGNTQARSGPNIPPIITDAPPASILLAQPMVQQLVTNNNHFVSNNNKPPSHPSLPNNHNHRAHRDSVSSTNSKHSARTSLLTSMPSLPKSPISYDSTFTSPAMSPDFDNRLSPLQHRSPSFSPIVTPKGMGSTTSSQHTSNRAGSTRSNFSGVQVVPHSSDSEREFQI